VVEITQGAVGITAPDPQPGTTVLEILAPFAAISLTAPCGGKGRCGKCVVSLPDGAPEPSEADRRFLSSEALARGERLACTCPAAGIARVVVPARDTRAHFKDAIPHFDAPADVWSRAAAAGSYAVAIDIGTTTVAAYLVATGSTASATSDSSGRPGRTRSAPGEVIAVTAEMNRQAIYGADVLSRISYSEQHPEGLSRLATVIRAQLSEMITTLATGAGLSAPNATGGIGLVAITANTTMLHLLAGVSPAGIGRAPFVPAFVESREMAAEELGLPTAGPVILLPSRAAYVGADIMSAAVAVNMDTDSRATLLVDIGTNGELALSHGGTVYTCATAAGPAFEGASISAGVGGISGAIASWRRQGTELTLETIENTAPVGVCGSGLLDLVASLLDDGVVDETGRMIGDDPDELEEIADGAARAAWAPRLIEDNGEPAVVMAATYHFTQGDVREVQLAKAAIAAGIDVLCAEAGIPVSGIERLVLTGGFGNHLRVASAVRVGLLPALPEERYVTVDNAAGRGAIEVIRTDGTMERTEKLALQARYIELSGHALFQERYIEQMMFPEEEL
jgi:uncharacterized 2Fe-2S/4Fe-4S cluster protein (DUF4445 family)